MLVYLAIIGLLPGINTSPIDPEIDNVHRQVRQIGQACFDRVDPRTGVSDCPYWAAYCTDPMYWEVMWEQCPLTCGRCPGVLPNPGNCFDRVDPRTGVSDCPYKAAYCTHPAYKEVMWEQCPLTCNVCPGILPNY